MATSAAFALSILSLLSADPEPRSPTKGPEWLRSMVPSFGVAIAVVGNDLAVGRSFIGGRPVSRGWEPRGGGVHLFKKGADGTWTEYAMLEPKPNAPADRFGAAVASDGTRLAVGAPDAAPGGVVYIFERSGSTWKETARLSAPDGKPGDGFGSTLVMKGNVLLVAAPGRDSLRGAVYQLRATGASWSAATRITAGTVPNGSLGLTLAWEKDRLYIGAPASMASGPVGANPGQVLVLRQNGDAWATEATLAPPPTDSAAGFGTGIAAVGNEIWIGAPGSRRGIGTVYRMTGSGSSWTVASTLQGPPPPPADTSRPQYYRAEFGGAIHTAAGQVLISSPGSGYPSTPGMIHVYGQSNGQWTEVQRLTPGYDDRAGFGTGFAPVGAEIVVSAPNATSGTGAIHLLSRSGGQWKVSSPIEDKQFSLPAVVGSERKCTADAIEGYPCQNVDLLAFLPVSAIGGKRGSALSGVWGWTDPETGREYAIAGRVDGAAFVDITDPAHPVLVADVPPPPKAKRSIYREVMVYKNHALIVSDCGCEHGVQIFDLTRLRGVKRAPETLIADTVYTGVWSIHTIAANEGSGFAYALGGNTGGEVCGGSVHMIDVRDPKRPKFAGCHIDPQLGSGYVHDAMCANYRGPDSRFTGREICYSSGGKGLGIADVTDKPNPKILARAEYPNVGFTHQGWITDDHKYFFLSDETDELSNPTMKTRIIVWDISTLDEPVLVKEWFGNTHATDHNLYINGRYLYLANYVGGLRVLDIVDPKNPVEIGYFDTVPWGENSPGFQGVWNNYPFFKSGTVIMSSMSQGLFIVRPRRERPVP